MLLDRKYPFESTNITVESFPLNLTFSPGEKELTTPICTFEPVSQRRDADRFVVPNYVLVRKCGR